MERPARILTPLIAVAVLAALAGCSDGSSDSGGAPTSSTPAASPTTSTDRPQPVESAVGLQLDGDGCPVLPHGWNLCNDEHQTWQVPLETDEEGYWTKFAAVGFSADGTVTWSESEAAESDGTWEYDGADAIVVRFSAVVPSLGTDTLSLKVDEFERGCGDPPVYEPWDALTSARPALRIEPNAC